MKAIGIRVQMQKILKKIEKFFEQKEIKDAKKMLAYCDNQILYYSKRINDLKIAREAYLKKINSA
jgi:hypothetical protein